MQTIIVILVLLFAVIIVAIKIFSSIKKITLSENPCKNCAQKCELKQLMDKKQKECSVYNKKTAHK
jgi:uncharacterized protein YpmB